MKTKLLLYSFILNLLFFSCTKENTNPEQCTTLSNLGITNSDNKYLFQQNSDEGSEWYGFYSEDLVEIHVNYDADSNHPNRTDIGYVFKKVDNCLEFYYAYHSVITWTFTRGTYTVNVNEVIIQDWIEDELISGEITETNNRGEIITRKFWVEFDTNDQYDYSYNANTTENCIDIVTPKVIDLNNDGIIDISLEKVDLPLTNVDINVRATNSIKLVTHNNNSILWGDYHLFSEAPFTSSGRNEHIPGNNWSDTLSILFEYNPPYDRFNFWYASIGAMIYSAQDTPWATIPNIINNNADDYLIVKIEKDGLFYYGWIKMKIDFDNCQFDVLETYLNPIPNQHIEVL